MATTPSRKTNLSQPLRSSSAGRVGGDPPKISFLAFACEMGSDFGVKSHHFREKIQIFARMGDFLLDFSAYAIMLAMSVTKTTKPNHLKDLLLLFAIPIAIVVFASAIIYVPRLLANPEYDFIYAVCDDYPCKNDYSIDSSGKVTMTKYDSDYDNLYAQIRYYDASSDSTQPLTFEQSQQYKLNASSKSPDGYSLNKESNNRVFLFGGNYDEGWYLQNGMKKKRVELSNTESYTYRNVKFLGWVEK